jgi:hypothetical protein
MLWPTTGVFCELSTLVATSSRFFGNSVLSNHTAMGGGIGGIGKDATLQNCAVFSNSVTGQ